MPLSLTVCSVRVWFGLIWFGLVEIPESDSLFSEGKREGSGVFGDGERGRGGKTGV